MLGFIVACLIIGSAIVAIWDNTRRHTKFLWKDAVENGVISHDKQCGWCNYDLSHSERYETKCPECGITNWVRDNLLNEILNRGWSSDVPTKAARHDPIAYVNARMFLRLRNRRGNGPC